jgi:hypothetical protein
MGIDLRTERIIDVRREAPAYLGVGRTAHISFFVGVTQLMAGCTEVSRDKLGPRRE